MISLEKDHTMAEPLLEISVERAPFECYVLDKIGLPIISTITIKNASEDVIKSLYLKITSDSGTVEPYELHLEALDPDEEIAFEPPLRLADAMLINANEIYEETVRIQISHEEANIFSESFDIDIYPFDQWAAFAPQTIACFVTPNHPAIASILVRASDILNDWTQNSALDAYQSGDPERARKIAGAIFHAIREQAIVYAEPPASFAHIGQRVRFAGDVLTQHIGTCIDLSVLYASCLEQAGLNPFIVFIQGHAFAGAWLEDTTFPEIITDDPSQITKGFARGVDKLFVTECTMLCNHSNDTFDQACSTAQKHMLNQLVFDVCVDIKRAHRGGLTPMPVRVLGANGWELQAPQTTSNAEAVLPTERTVSKAYIDQTSEGNLTRVEMWERNLLDLSLRNNLINMRIGGKLIPLAAPNLDDLEDALAMGTALALMEKPSEWGAVDISFELASAISEYAEFLHSEFASKRLRSFATPTELSRSVTALYRSAHTTLDETGVNTLFVTLGALKWIKDGKFRYAPLILIPVDIIRKSAKKGFSVVTRDEDPQLNVSLLEMLRRDFGIDIGGLDPLPTDEHGVDTRTVFNTFKHKIREQAGWEVLEIACLGTFSFSSFFMWQDIHQHVGELSRSKVVDSLINGHLTWEAEPMELPDNIERDGALVTVQADASQLFAIKEAAAGKSFVLHGPPGTGKSQVITGLIANALYQGLRVLFVSEKAAALNVVQSRLEALGIGKLCLEMHSNKTTKSHILDQLEQASELKTHAFTSSYDQKLASILQLKAKLDTYANALYETNEANLTLREQISRYEKYRAFDVPAISIHPDYVTHLRGLAEFEEDLRNVELLAAATKDIGDPSTHPLAMLKEPQFSHSLKLQLPHLLPEITAAITACIPAGATLATTLGKSAPCTEHDWVWLDGVVKQAMQESALPISWLKEQDLAGLVSKLDYVLNQKQQLDAFVIAQQTTWTSQFFELNPDTIEKDWNDARATMVFKRKRAIADVVNRLASYSVAPFSEAQVPQAIATLRNFQSVKAPFESFLADIMPYVSEMQQFGNLDWDHIAIALNAAREQLNNGQSDEARTLRIELAQRSDLVQTCKSYSEARLQLTEKVRALCDLVGPITIDETQSWTEQILATVHALEQHVDLLQDWMRWRTQAQKIEARGLAGVVNALMQGVSPAILADAFRRSVYQLMCALSLEKHSAIASFSGKVFEEEVRQYAEADKELLKLSKQELQLRLISRIPNLTIVSRDGAEASVLQRAIRSKGRGVSIRQLLHDIPTLVQNLAPCMLMSPLSVAQYLDFDNPPFDLVIFDEASQLQTCKAIGALTRAKNAIIVGDPKQMPPTAFFQSQTSDEEFSDTTDLESILEDCLAINMPSTYLQWHYRSRHESLISFSNVQFYESKMCTFPSADDAQSKVSLVHVDGYYEGSGLNSFEAKAIVEELKRRFEQSNGQPPSIGVITFNVKQQNFIEDLLEEEYAKNPKFEAWALSGAEPLFVKNLENVQGDERDVVLFSVTYAPGENGKMAMRFGPINNEGGWRRLNVAVTRSRVEMMVFATLEPDNIDTNKTASKGVRALKNFLSFAKHGKFLGNNTTIRRSEDYIAADLCQMLSDKGFSPVRNVGSSAYKVDIAIKSHADSTHYLAGILLDGESYNTAKTTRDREVAREQMLRQLGWNIFKVWSVDWWSNPERIVDELVDALTRIADDEAASTGATQLPQVEAAPKVEVAAPAPAAAAAAAEPAAAPEPTPALAEPAADPAAEPEPAPAEPEPAAAPAEPEPAAEPTPAEPEPAPAEPAAEPAADQPSRVLPAKDDFVLGEFRPTALPEGPVLTSDEYQTTHTDEIAERFALLIENDTPLEKTQLCNRIRESFGIKQSGKRIQERNNQILKSVSHKEVKRGDEIFIWQKDAEPKQYTTCRIPAEGVALPACSDICDEELFALLICTIKEQGPLSKENLIRAAAARYGYKRVASRMQDVFANAIKKAKRKGLLIEEDWELDLGDLS